MDELSTQYNRCLKLADRGACYELSAEVAHLELLLEKKGADPSMFGSVFCDLIEQLLNAPQERIPDNVIFPRMMLLMHKYARLHERYDDLVSTPVEGRYKLVLLASDRCPLNVPYFNLYNAVINLLRGREVYEYHPDTIGEMYEMAVNGNIAEFRNILRSVPQCVEPAYDDVVAIVVPDLLVYKEEASVIMAIAKHLQTLKYRVDVISNRSVPLRIPGVDKQIVFESQVSERLLEKMKKYRYQAIFHVGNSLASELVRAMGMGLFDICTHADDYDIGCSTTLMNIAGVIPSAKVKHTVGDKPYAMLNQPRYAEGYECFYVAGAATTMNVDSRINVYYGNVSQRRDMLQSCKIYVTYDTQPIDVYIAVVTQVPIVAFNPSAHASRVMEWYGIRSWTLQELGDPDTYALALAQMGEVMIVTRSSEYSKVVEDELKRVCVVAGLDGYVEPEPEDEPVME